MANVLVSTDNIISMSNSAVGLARAFSIIVRQIADLMPLLRDSSELNNLDMMYLSFTAAESHTLLQSIEERLHNTWNWLINCMDSTESQLRFGCALSNRIASSTISTSSSSTPSPIPSLSLPSNVSSNRFNRLRSFQNPDDILFLPSLSRTNSSLRRITNFGLSRPSSSTTAANPSTTSSGAVASNNSTNTSANTSVSQVDSNAARRDFLNYTMSLMRAHSNEHYDSLPALDVASLKHIAYIFDSFVYFVRRGFPTTNNSHVDSQTDVCSDNLTSNMVSTRSSNASVETAKEESTEIVECEGQNNRFFRRSNSTLYLGCPPPDPFSAPFHEALPLASRPHLLQPNARREQLFGIPRPSNTTQAEELIQSMPSQMSLLKRYNWNKCGTNNSSTNSSNQNQQQRNQSVIAEASPTFSRGSIIQQANVTPTKQSVIVLAGSAKHHSSHTHLSSCESIESKQQQQHTSVTNSKCCNNFCVSQSQPSTKSHFFGNQQQHDALLGRWRLTLELFGRLFVEDVGLEPYSIMMELSGFPVKETKFRREMERLRNPHSSSNSQRDISFLKLDRDRNTLLQQTFKELNSVFSTQTRRLNAGQPSQHLAITRVKVTFKDEPGEGSGVARSFYTAFSEAVLANEKLPPLDVLNVNSSTSNNIQSTRSPLSSGSVNPLSSLETYQNYIYRIRSNSSYLANSGTNRPSSSVASSNSASPQSQVITLPQSDNNLSNSRPPRSPGRVRLFGHSRRSQILERTINVRTSSSGNIPPVSNPSILPSRSRSNGSASSSSVLRYESPPFTPIARFSTSAILSSDSRVSLGMLFTNYQFTIN